jgi:hypothetical protein
MADIQTVENLLFSNALKIPLEDSDTDDEFLPMTTPCEEGDTAEVLWAKARRTLNPKVTQRKMLAMEYMIEHYRNCHLHVPGPTGNCFCARCLQYKGRRDGLVLNRTHAFPKIWLGEVQADLKIWRKSIPGLKGETCFLGLIE